MSREPPSILGEILQNEAVEQIPAKPTQRKVGNHRDCRDDLQNRGADAAEHHLQSVGQFHAEQDLKFGHAHGPGSVHHRGINTGNAGIGPGQKRGAL